MTQKTIMLLCAFLKWLKKVDFYETILFYKLSFEFQKSLNSELNAGAILYNEH